MLYARTIRNVAMLREWLSTGATIKSITAKHNLAQGSFDQALRWLLEKQFPSLHIHAAEYATYRGQSTCGWIWNNKDRVLHELNEKFGEPTKEASEPMSRHLCDSCRRTECCKWFGRSTPEAGILPVTICRYHEAVSTDGYIKIPHGIYLALININSAITIVSATEQEGARSQIHTDVIVKQREIIASIAPMTVAK